MAGTMSHTRHASASATATSAHAEYDLLEVADVMRSLSDQVAEHHGQWRRCLGRPDGLLRRPGCVRPARRRGGTADDHPRRPGVFRNAGDRPSTSAGRCRATGETGVAMGILMHQHRLTRTQAFDVLRVASQNSNRKLAQVAVDVADTGVLSISRPS